MAEMDALDALLRKSWHAVARVEDIGDAPVPVTLLDERLVIARLDGEIRVFDDQCPHRGAALSVGWIQDDSLVCPYHGWRYGGDGACVRIPSLGDDGRLPARAALRPRHLAVHLGLVWVALDEPVLGLPESPEFDRDIRIVACPPYDWECHATRRIENFLDFADFPWIHPGILGDPEQPLVAPHTVTRDANVIRVHQTRIEPTNDDVKTGGLATDDVGDGTVTTEMHYLVHLPLTAQLHQELPGGRDYVVWLTASPMTGTSTRTFWFVGRNYAVDEDDDKFVRFQQDVVAQDRPVIESQRPHRIPFDLTDELYVKDDKFGLEFRRGLLEYGGARPVLVSELPVLRRHWHPVRLASAIGDAPVAVRLLGEEVVVWRVAGVVRAAIDRCPHRLARLSGGAVEDDRLMCAYHAWCFDGDGVAVDIPQLEPNVSVPPKARLAMVHARERYGAVWIALEDPVAAVPAFPEADHAGYRLIPSFDEEWNASAFWVADNAIDIAHVNVVHAATIGDPTARRMAPYAIEPTAAGFLARMSLSVTGVAAQSAVDGGTVERSMEVEVIGPLATRVAIRYPNGREHVLFIVASPVDDTTCRYVQLLARNDTEEDVPAADLLAVDRAVVSEDRRICELLPTDFPLDPGATISLRADRITVEYRRHLARLLTP